MTAPPPTVATVLAEARSRGVARLDALLMLARVMATSRSWLLAHEEAPLDTAVTARWRNWLERRADDEPLAYLLGEKEFRGLRLEVTPAVLVPRPETELLVDWACALLDGGRDDAEAIDLGTGSGAVAIALKHARPQVRVTATDASAAALAVARSNAKRLSLPIEYVLASWWQGLAGRRFDLALSNPPYVSADDPALAALRHEPRAALTPGSDGLAALRAIVAGASDHLAPTGWLVLEHGFDQAAAVRALLGDAGFDAIETRADLAGHPRASGGRRGASR